MYSISIGEYFQCPPLVGAIKVNWRYSVALVAESYMWGKPIGPLSVLVNVCRDPQTTNGEMYFFWCGRILALPT